MSKTRLQVEYDFDFLLIGIVCHEKDYRLCWLLNTLFNLHLSKTDDHTTEHGAHSLFHYSHEELFREYNLIANRGTAGMLIEEHRQIDYFFMVNGTIEEDEKKHFIEQLKKQDIILGAYAIDAQNLKSKHNLVF